ncbi:MAG: recombination protein RarA, partial [Cyanobium sp.]
AAAEHDAELGEVLSSGPEDPALERWLQRQLTGEGERLDQLRQRLWRDADWRRHDRVLILEARSLLWALDPLQHTPEGGVAIQAAGPDDLQRLQAQLQVLDDLQRPQLLQAPLAELGRQLEPGQAYEWIAGRHPWRGAGDQRLQRDLKALSGLAAPTARLRLLFTKPLLGPAGAALAVLQGQASGGAGALAAERRSLEAAAALEPGWLPSDPESAEVATRLQAQGWHLETEQWEEDLILPLGPELLQRWFAAAAPYRRQLEQALGPATGETVHRLLRSLEGQGLPQRLQHRLLRGRMDGGQSKAPDQPGQGT